MWNDFDGIVIIYIVCLIVDCCIVATGSVKGRPAYSSQALVYHKTLVSGGEPQYRLVPDAIHPKHRHVLAPGEPVTRPNAKDCSKSCNATTAQLRPEFR